MELIIALSLFIGMIVSWLRLPAGAESTIVQAQVIERIEETTATVRQAA